MWHSLLPSPSLFCLLRSIWDEVSRLGKGKNETKNFIFHPGIKPESPALKADSFFFFLWFYLFLFFVFKFYFIFKLYITVLVLPTIKMNPPQVYMCSPSWTLLPPPSPFHPSGSSQCTSPEHPVSCIERGLATHFIHDILHVSMPFSQINPPSPSPTESKRLFYTSVSLLLSCIQGYHYHLSKFHIYALVYCIGVFLSGLLHSV